MVAPREKAPLLRPAGRRTLTRATAPTLTLEKQMWAEGHEVVVGLDEVGRGAWAGPLAVGAAVLPQGRRVLGVRDSKMLSEREREGLFDRIAGWCTAWHVGMASQVECDELGMTAAQRLAASRAIAGLGVTPDKVLLDGSWDFVGRGTTIRVIKGDATVLSIAAASILAKVTRDRLMRELHEHYPWWWFDDNKGYPCPKHKAVLQGIGPSAIHRRSWVFMDNIPWGGRTWREPPAARAGVTPGLGSQPCR